MDQNEVTSALSDWWELFRRLGFFWGRFVVGCVFVAILVTFKFWKLMVPFWVLGALVIVYLRFTREKDSL